MIKARAVAVTKPLVPEAGTPGEFIAYAARVSNPANQANKETSPRLLRYLAREQHWSPFEMAHMVVEVTTTRDIARQMLLHRSFAFQEFSQRYAEQTAEPVIRECRMQDAKNRQNSLETDDEKLAIWWEDAQRETAAHARAVYTQALVRGIAEEQARAVLPEGNTQSVLYMAGSVRSFIHYLTVRRHASTQKEHREVAEAIEHVLFEQFPELATIFD